MRKKIVPLFLALVMVLAYATPVLKLPGAKVYATSKTADEAISWVQSKVGTKIDMDGAPTDQPYQCVDLVKAYYSYLGVSPVQGNGADYVSNSLPSGWTRVKNGTPQKGDILVYTGGSKGFGHVGIYEANRITYHQNVNGPYVEKITAFAYNGFTETPYWGYIRPNWSNAPTPVDYGADFYSNIGVYNGSSFQSMGINANNNYNVGFVGGNDPTTDEGRVKSDTYKSRFWRYRRNSDGSYRINSCLYTDYYLTAEGTSDGSNVKVVKGYDANNARQRWFFYKDSNGYYYCKSAASNYYLWYNQSHNLQIRKKDADHEKCERTGIYRFDPISGSTTLTVNATTTDKNTVFTWTKPTGTVAWYNIQIRRLDSAGNEISNEYDQMNMLADNTKTSFTRSVAITTPGNYTAICYPHSWVNYVASTRLYFTVSEAGPVITTQPKAVSVAAGEKATFKVAATGSGLTYQWQYKNPKMSAFATTGLAGNKTDTLSFTPSAAYDGIQFRCIVTDKNGKSVTSSTALLTVLSELKITTQPKAVSVSAGEKATFKVAATGNGLTYQWQYKNPKMSAFANTNLAGNKTDTLSFTPSAAYDGIQFRCVVTDRNGKSVTSSAALLTVQSELKITTQPKAASVAAGQKVTFKVAATGSGLTYQWQYKNPKMSSFANTGLAGNKTDTLSFTPSAAYDGIQFRCVVTDRNGKSVTSSTALLTVQSELKITTQPADVSVASGNKATFKVAAQGSGLKYQWQYKNSKMSSFANTGLAGNKTATLSFNATEAFNGIQFRCIVTDSSGASVTSRTANLTVN